MSRKNNANNKSTRGRSNNVQKSNFMGPLPRNQSRSAGQKGNMKSFQGDSKLFMAPVAKSKTIKTSRALITTLKNGDCRIVHREYIRDVIGTAAFSNTGSPINPGQSALFGWLSRIAKNFESYTFSKLRFLFETEAATSQTGSLILAVDYDATDAIAVSKQQIMSFRNSVRSAPWSACQHDSTSEDLHKQKSYYVRNGNQPANTDLKLYDIGTFQVATIGNSVATLGELYVEYDVLLKTPQLDIDQSASGGSVTAGGTMSGANPVGTTPTSDLQNLGFTMSTGSVITWTVPGTYIVVYHFVGTGITALASQALGASVTTLNASQSVIDTAGENIMIRSEFLVSDLVAPTADITISATTITSGKVDVGFVPTGSLN